MSVLSFVPGLFALVAQWIGVLAMRGTKAKGWWVMLAGVCVSTSGPLLGIIATLFGEFFGASGSLGPGVFFMLLGLGSIGGGLLFGIGFAVHALGMRAAAERQAQLESLTAAMAEELRVMRAGN
ncbi:hypothetical protein KBB96_01795 [Luteolibacter ambystomatis]|uniref:Uncharacterized protein n=1 Tax=Luteolibacter ambystomatis TaxID=2824561 RepID=A0A975PET6_9BACT|nr:hypothetical protein [Luteolibacter ambystomatis]QUE51638.1 hypothetical protein KBB96_01795 [Luteolibacter ambystomatis]